MFPGGGGRCFSQCGRYWSPRELAELLGVTLPAPSANPGLTLAELAAAKGLPEEFLRSLGVADGFAGAGAARRPCVDIPYPDQGGEVAAVRKRLALHGDNRFIWRRDDHVLPYGLPRLAEAGGWAM